MRNPLNASYFLTELYEIQIFRFKFSTSVKYDRTCFENLLIIPFGFGSVLLNVNSRVVTDLLRTEQS